MTEDQTKVVLDFMRRVGFVASAVRSSTEPGAWVVIVTEIEPG